MTRTAKTQFEYDYGYPEEAYENLVRLVEELFTFLDYTETSSNGHEWHPIQVSCARAMMVGPLSECLARLKEAIQ